MDIVSTIKEVIDLGLEIQRSIEKVRCNKETSNRFSTEIACDLSKLQSLMHGYSFQADEQLYVELHDVKQEMTAVHEICVKLIPKADKTVMSLTRAKLKAWRKRDNIEAELIQLKNRVHDCLFKFTVYSTARIERAAYRLEHSFVGQIVESRIQSQHIGGILETYLIKTPAGAQIVQQVVAIASDDRAHRTLESQYLHLVVIRLLESIDCCASRRRYTSALTTQSADSAESNVHEMPDWNHLRPIEIVSSAQRTELATIIFCILDLVQTLKDFGDEIPMQACAWMLRNLAVNMDRTKSLDREAEGVYTWALKLYRTLARTEPVFLPYLALNLTDHFANLSDAEEAYTICATICDTLPWLYSPTLEISTFTRYADKLLQEQRFAEALPIAQRAVEICRTTWALPISPIEGWKRGNPESPQTRQYRHTVVSACLALSNLARCLMHAGHLDASYAIAKELLTHFSLLPHWSDFKPIIHPDDDNEYSVAGGRTLDVYLNLSMHLRKENRLEEAYGVMLESSKAARKLEVVYCPLIVLETLEVLHAMYCNQSLRFTHIGDLVLVLLNSGTWDLSSSISRWLINLYILLCLRCGENTADNHIIGFAGWEELITAFKNDDDGAMCVVDDLLQLALSEISTVSPKLSAFLARHINNIWHYIFLDCVLEGELFDHCVSFFFSWDYQKSVEAITSQLTPCPKIDIGFNMFHAVLEVIQESSTLSLESSLIEKSVTLGAKALQGYKLILEDPENLNSDLDKANYTYHEFGRASIGYVCILDVCELHMEALETANVILHDRQHYTTYVALEMLEHQSKILMKLKQHDEAVSAARELVAGWEGYDPIGIRKANSLDLLWSTLSLVGDTAGAEEARAKADHIWASWGEVRVAASPNEAAITEVVDDVAKDSNIPASTGENPSPDYLTTPSESSVKESSIRLLTSEPVAPDSTPVMDSSMGTEESELPPPTLVLTKEPIISLKVTCTNTTLAWGAVYLAILTALFMAVRSIPFNNKKQRPPTMSGVRPSCKNSGLPPYIQAQDHKIDESYLFEAGIRISSQMWAD
ncbi:hypothetical protein C8J56DRAFT_1126848 [Mycena floridula]|nr:hypothetical protein C8J56DRAFT_1126848 [Mycena floridula]